MVKRNDEEEENGDKDKPSILDRVGAAAEAAGERVRRSTEVMTGADIRKFEEFTEAATTAVIGVYQDQAGLREQLAAKEQSLRNLQQDQAKLQEQLAHAEQSLHALQQNQATLRDDVARMKYTLVVAWGIASAVSVAALALSIVALLA